MNVQEFFLADIKAEYIPKIEAILDLFPEVKWDRWSGELSYLVVFGWIAREDSHEDFITIKFALASPIELVTSSAKYSEEFSKRLSFGHSDCQRVEGTFKVNCIKISGKPNGAASGS